MSQPISRVPSACAVAIIPLALGSLLGSSTQPAFDPDQIIESLFELAPGGVYHAFFIAKKAVSSYLAVSPLPLAWRSVLCCTSHGLAPSRRYLAPCPMELGLSSPMTVFLTTRVHGSDCPVDSGHIIA